VALQVHLAEERKDERDVVAAAHAGVERLSRRYRELMQSLSPGEQLKADRALGRPGLGRADIRRKTRPALFRHGAELQPPDDDHQRLHLRARCERRKHPLATSVHQR